MGKVGELSPPLSAEWGLQIKTRLTTENNVTLVVALLCSE